MLFYTFPTLALSTVGRLQLASLHGGLKEAL